MVSEEEMELKLRVPATFSWQDESKSKKSKKKPKNVQEEDLDQIQKVNDSDNDDEEDNIFDGTLKHNPARRTSRSRSRRESRPSIGRQTSRYADRIRGEDEAAHLGFMRHLQRREGHLRSRQELLEDGENEKEKNKAGAEEAFDFFCKEWRVEDKDLEQHGEENEGEEEDSPEVQGSDKRKLLTSDILGGYDTYDWNMTEPIESWVESKSKLRAAEKENYFHPSNDKVDISRKLNENERPRFKEEEGIYIGERPKVPAKVKNKVENRILYEYERGGRTGESKSWFGQDGRLASLPDPSLRPPTRPSPPDEDENRTSTDPALETLFCPPNLLGADETVASVAQPGVKLLFLKSGEDAEAAATALTHCQLEVDVASVVFDHHHLFSLEHHLAVRLTEGFEVYQKTLSRQLSLSVHRRLKLLYDAVDELRDKFELYVQHAERDFQLRRLESYRREIMLVRRQRDEESLKERTALRDMSNVWRDLKELRQRQGFSNTTVKLVTHREEADGEADRREWESELARELQERREEHEAGMAEANRRYEEELREWKVMHNKRRDARKRKKHRELDCAAGSGTADAAEMEADENILAQPEQEKPERPKPFDEQEELEKIESHAKRCRRPPGEAKRYFELKQDEIQDNRDGEATGVDSREKARRTKAAKTKIFVKLYFNGREVCHSRSLPLSAFSPSSSDFVINIANIFPLQIVQWPNTLKLQILEGGPLRPTMLGEVTLQLPECDVTLDSLADAASLNPVPFTSEHRARHADTTAIGSLVDFSANPEGTQIRSEMIRGRVFARVGWAKTADGIVLSPPSAQWRPPRTAQAKEDVLHSVLDSGGSVDPDKLEEWMRSNNVDPNDPANAELMDRLANATSIHHAGGANAADESPISSAQNLPQPVSAGGHFRLDSHHDQLVFCSQSDIDRNLRFRLLQLRREGQIPESCRMVPPSEKEIPKGLFDNLGKKASETRRMLVGSGDPLRSKGRIHLEKLRQQISHHFSVARRRKRHSDVVMEDPAPNFATFGALLGEIAPQSRPLRPVRAERTKVPLQDGQEVKILLSVVRAYDVPVRVDHDPIHDAVANPVSSLRTTSVSSLQQQQQQATTPRMGTSDAQRDALPSEALVRSYIEARFQNDSARTSSAPGPNPAWNQQLTLNLSGGGGGNLSSETLDTIKDHLHIHLFDEVSVDLLEDPSERSHHIHKRLEQKWLGSLSVPFSSLYRNTRVEGTFRLHSPAVLLGYERTGHLGGVAAGSGDDGDLRQQSRQDATYVNLYLTVEPPLSVPDPPAERLECAEEGEAVVKLCERWSRDMANKFPDRKIYPLIADVNGRWVLMTRYLRGIRPPDYLLSLSSVVAGGEGDQAVEQSADKADMVAWFVSLIPYMAKNTMFPGLQEIWPTSADFLNCLCGSECEHAVLLANYFTGMDKRAYLVLGQGVPEGSTAYVLTIEESGDPLLWNPVTGESFSTAATFCPLQSVHAVIDQTNVWGNLQPSSCPSRMRWTLSSTSDWMPLFGHDSGSAGLSSGAGNPNLPSVQPAQLTTSAPDKRAAHALKDRLERVLRETLMRLRPRQRTTINWNGNAVLRRLLPGLEAARGGMASASSDGQDKRGIIAEHMTELSRLNASYKVCGFPMHFAYHDVEQLCEALRATGVHLNREPKVEFALAVHVEPYPSTVMSVWVYVASMIRRDLEGGGGAVRRSTVTAGRIRGPSQISTSGSRSRRSTRAKVTQDDDSEDSD